MSSPALRTLVLFGCTLSTFMVMGRAPGAINLRLRDIETVIAAEGKSGRDKKVAIRPTDGVIH